jgi:hypothetical protein
LLKGYSRSIPEDGLTYAQEDAPLAQAGSDVDVYRMVSQLGVPPVLSAKHPKNYLQLPVDLVCAAELGVLTQQHGAEVIEMLIEIVQTDESWDCGINVGRSFLIAVTGNPLHNTARPGGLANG